MNAKHVVKTFFESDFYKTSYNNEWMWGAPEATHTFVMEKYNEYFN